MEENKKVWIAGIGFVVLVVLVLAIYYFFIREKPPEMPVQPEIVEEAVVPSETEEISEEPQEVTEQIQVNLDESDEPIRDLAANLSSQPELMKWLSGSKDLARKFVAAVDNIANGQSPRNQIGFFKPDKEFAAVEGGGEFFLDPASYLRYSVVAEVFTSLDSEGSVKLYRQSYTIIQEAYRDLGYPSGNFQKTLLQAIDELLQVPIAQKDIRLEKKLLSYALADPQLENLSQAQKHLFRMGPQNILRIQLKLKEFKTLLANQ